MKRVNAVIGGLAVVGSLIGMADAQQLQVTQGGIRFSPSGSFYPYELSDYYMYSGCPILYCPSAPYPVGFVGGFSDNERILVGMFEWLTVRYFSEDSDERGKTNIRDLATVLPKLAKVRTVQYDNKVTAPSNSPGYDRISKMALGRTGFLAQDLMKEFPAMVVQNEKTGMYSVRYTEMVPVLLKAINELKGVVDEQNKRIAQLEAAVR